MFLEREEGGRTRGRETWMPERNMGQLPLLRALMGMEHATQACVLTGNQTGNLSICGTMPNQTGPTSQGDTLF